MADAETQAPTQITGQTASPPKQGEPCEECGSPLAADQRYCLNCGRRRGGPRVDYRHYMGGGTGSGEPPTPAVEQPAADQEPSKPQRDYAPLAAVGGIAVLGAMLLIGVLIGRGNGDNTAATPPPVVIKGPSGESSGSEAGGAPKNTGGGLGGGGAKRVKKASRAAGTNTGNAVQASESDLEELGNTSGENYVKQSENLPNEIATPGAPPPIDKSTPPGGGEGGGEVIKWKHKSNGDFRVFNPGRFSGLVFDELGPGEAPRSPGARARRRSSGIWAASPTRWRAAITSASTCSPARRRSCSNSTPSWVRWSGC